MKPARSSRESRAKAVRLRQKWYDSRIRTYVRTTVVRVYTYVYILQTQYLCQTHLFVSTSATWLWGVLTRWLLSGWLLSGFWCSLSHWACGAHSRLFSCVVLDKHNHHKLSAMWDLEYKTSLLSVPCLDALVPHLGRALPSCIVLKASQTIIMCSIRSQIRWLESACLTSWVWIDASPKSAEKLESSNLKEVNQSCLRAGLQWSSVAPSIQVLCKDSSRLLCTQQHVWSSQNARCWSVFENAWKLAVVAFFTQCILREEVSGKEFLHYLDNPNSWQICEQPTWSERLESCRS